MAGLYLAASDGGGLPQGGIDPAYFNDITTGCESTEYQSPYGTMTVTFSLAARLDLRANFKTSFPG